MPSWAPGRFCSPVPFYPRFVLIFLLTLEFPDCAFALPLLSLSTSPGACFPSTSVSSLPVECFPAHTFFSIEVSLAAVNLDTWSSLFSHSAPSSHSASILPSLSCRFCSHSLSLSSPVLFIWNASVCLHIYFTPPAWPVIHPLEILVKKKMVSSIYLFHLLLL